MLTNPKRFDFFHFVMGQVYKQFIRMKCFIVLSNEIYNILSFQKDKRVIKVIARKE